MFQSKQLSPEHLPYEVVFDILTRLPVRSLVRFRCVSKSWNSIITSPDFITTHMNRPKSLSNNKGYLLYVPTSDHYDQNLCIDVCNSDRTLTHISTFQLPFSAYMVGCCNGMFCLHNFPNKVLYLWNPSIRKFKMISTPHFTHPFFPYNLDLRMELAYHSQNNDFKILGILCFRGSEAPQAEAVVYTLSTDSWKRVVISLGSIDYISPSPNLFFNGALHSIAWSRSRKFILSFNVNDERFREIMLPQNYEDHILLLPMFRLAVFKGSLAFLVWGASLESGICWVMREYGVVESWTKISVPLDSVKNFFGCTDSGELLVDIKDRGLVSYDPVSLNENNLGIQSPSWLTYTADLMENLVLQSGKMSSKYED